MSRGGRRLWLVCAVAAVSAFCGACPTAARLIAGSVEADELAPVIVVLHSYHPGFTWTENISEGINAGFEDHGEVVELRFEYLDARRIASEDYLRSVDAMLRTKYAEIDVDVVISADDQALHFLLGIGSELFSDVPLVFCSASSFDPAMRKGREITGLIEKLNIAETLSVALELHSGTKEVVVISDTTRTGRAMRAKAEAIFEPIEDSVKFRYLDDLTVEELEEETATLDDGAIVFLFIFSRDQAGRVFSHEDNLRRIRAVCGVPIYSVWEFYLGHGIVGGKLTAGREEGRLVAEMAQRIVHGERASEIPLGQSPSRYIFDARELERFGIDERRLPEGSVVIARPHSIYREYRRMFWTIGATFAVLGTLVVFLVVNTLRRRHAEAVQARFADILASTSDFVATATPLGEITYINPAGRRLIGWGEDEDLEGQRIRDVQPAWVLRLIRDEAGPVSTEQGVWAGETAVIHRDGSEIPVSQVILGHHSRAGEIEFYSTIVRDLRPRIETENALRAIEEHLEHSRKMEAIGQLAGGVAHDFNNLLAGIMGNADLLTVLLPDGSREARRAKEIVAASDKAAALTRQLLTFSRKGSFKTEIVDLRDVVDGVINLLSRSIDRRIEIERRFLADRSTVVGDANQIENAMLNLAVNARDAMPDGGLLLFTVGTVTEDEDSLAVRSGDLEAGDYVEVVVSDTGVGIPKNMKAKIFEPFFTTKGPGEGTGLGLATAYGCVRNHNGLISVQSQPGKGSRFRILLPLADNQRVETPVPTEVDVIPRGEGHVLVVDDERVVRDVLCESLESLGYTVTACEDGRQAVELYERDGGEIDLVILDLIMPRMNGADTLVALKQIDPGVRVILSSGFSPDAESQHLLEEGALGFMVKPFSLNELAETVSTAMYARSAAD